VLPFADYLRLVNIDDDVDALLFQYQFIELRYHRSTVAEMSNTIGHDEFFMSISDDTLIEELLEGECISVEEEIQEEIEEVEEDVQEPEEYVQDEDVQEDHMTYKEVQTIHSSQSSTDTATSPNAIPPPIKAIPSTIKQTILVMQPNRNAPLWVGNPTQGETSSLRATLPGKLTSAPQGLRAIDVPVLNRAAVGSISGAGVKSNNSQVPPFIRAPTRLQSPAASTLLAGRNPDHGYHKIVRAPSLSTSNVVVAGSSVTTKTSAKSPVATGKFGTAAPANKEGPPLVIKDIRQCKPFHTDSLANLKLKLDYVDRMLKTQQTLLGKLRGRSLFLTKDNYRLKKSIGELKSVIAEQEDPSEDNKYVLVFNNE